MRNQGTHAMVMEARFIREYESNKQAAASRGGEYKMLVLNHNAVKYLSSIFQSWPGMKSSLSPKPLRCSGKVKRELGCPISDILVLASWRWKMFDNCLCLTQAEGGANY